VRLSYGEVSYEGDYQKQQEGKIKTFQSKVNVVEGSCWINPFSQIERMGFCFFAKERQSLKILANGKDKDIEETSLKQSISLK